MENRFEKSAYADSGYIVDQRRLTDIRYGVRTSDLNGCGWIAAYNFLRGMGDTAQPQSVANALARHSMLRGRLGTSPFRLKRYLRRRGYPLHSAFGTKKAAEKAAGARAGIVLYRHSGGWHFVTFLREEDGRMHFFNAVSGAQNHVETMDAFLKRHNLARFVWLMYLPRAEAEV